MIPPVSVNPYLGAPVCYTKLEDDGKQTTQAFEFEDYSYLQ
jgi:hypothetical protein